MLLPHATWSHRNSHNILYNWDIKSYDIIQGFEHFTIINVISYQIELIITIFILY